MLYRHGTQERGASCPWPPTISNAAVAGDRPAERQPAERQPAEQRHAEQRHAEGLGSLMRAESRRDNIAGAPGNAPPLRPAQVELDAQSRWLMLLAPGMLLTRSVVTL